MNIPKGWKLVPVEPTDEMLDNAIGTCNFPSLVWPAILAAAPTPPAQECKCDLRTKLVGDGCEVCNPELASELEVERIADIPRVSEALANFAQDTTGDNGAEVVRAILECVAPAQEVEPVAYLWGGVLFPAVESFPRHRKEGLALYAHPQSDELRKAAEELIAHLYDAPNGQPPRGYVNNLRVALEKGK